MGVAVSGRWVLFLGYLVGHTFAETEHGWCAVDFCLSNFRVLTQLLLIQSRRLLATAAGRQAGRQCMVNPMSSYAEPFHGLVLE